MRDFYPHFIAFSLMFIGAAVALLLGAFLFVLWMEGFVFFSISCLVFVGLCIATHKLAVLLVKKDWL